MQSPVVLTRQKASVILVIIACGVTIFAISGFYSRGYQESEHEVVLETDGSNSEPFVLDQQISNTEPDEIPLTEPNPPNTTEDEMPLNNITVDMASPDQQNTEPGEIEDIPKTEQNLYTTVEEEMPLNNITDDMASLDESKTFQVSSLAPCGAICSYNGTLLDPDNDIYPKLRKDINCDNIMKRMAYRGHEIIHPPPKEPPKELYDEFVQYGELPIVNYNRYSSADWNRVSSFEKYEVDRLISHTLSGIDDNPYTDDLCVQKLLYKYKGKIEDNKVFVIGTIVPWLESTFLAYGADSVITLEYGNITIYDDRIKVHSPYSYAEDFLQGKTELFDIGASFSSLEHSGLGRYGDPLNPYGDLEAMAQAWCMIKSGGLFAVGVPYYGDDRSFIEWNAHRGYGSKRLQHLLANWNYVDYAYCKDKHAHHFFIVSKPQDSSSN